uniref:Uncharacterized protein n=1 Tax=Chromera velia CCMP2878 TaxID=1169474 RepID=A0A0G4H8G0_9ALVE|eukprot:Cvel_5881.t1-p1 / transcript=Cvel_5881.t1 / gene=Cvel_5881 / organism=Chromera_velia_CCMP2878 / gene_product=hypothetical protein / transcript_product=hypothetical protein / location=Cvel_scaffold280:35216-40106(+) / protein_length=595 / sequence_SO=supercontig / SO=protein_coding / is_pseudo=false
MPSNETPTPESLPEPALSVLPEETGTSLPPCVIENTPVRPCQDHTIVALCRFPTVYPLDQKEWILKFGEGVRNQMTEQWAYAHSRLSCGQAESQNLVDREVPDTSTGQKKPTLLATVYNATERSYTLFVDDQPPTKSPFRVNLRNEGRILELGRGPGMHFSGSLYAVLLYDRVLTPKEVKEVGAVMKEKAQVPEPSEGDGDSNSREEKEKSAWLGKPSCCYRTEDLGGVAFVALAKTPPRVVLSVRASSSSSASASASSSSASATGGNHSVSVRVAETPHFMMESLRPRLSQSASHSIVMLLRRNSVRNTDRREWLLCLGAGRNNAFVHSHHWLANRTARAAQAGHNARIQFGAWSGSQVHNGFPWGRQAEDRSEWMRIVTTYSQQYEVYTLYVDGERIATLPRPSGTNKFLFSIHEPTLVLGSPRYTPELTEPRMDAEVDHVIVIAGVLSQEKVRALEGLSLVPPLSSRSSSEGGENGRADACGGSDGAQNGRRQTDKEVRIVPTLPPHALLSTVSFALTSGGRTLLQEERDALDRLVVPAPLEFIAPFTKQIVRTVLMCHRRLRGAGGSEAMGLGTLARVIVLDDILTLLNRF